MRVSSTSTSLVFNVGLSALFQLAVLYAASLEGVDKIGLVSLNYASATLIGAVLLSDLKSLSIRIFAKGEGISTLTFIRNIGLTSGALICLVFACSYPQGHIFAGLLFVRLFSQGADVYLSFWQFSNRPLQITLFSLLRFAVGGCVLVVSTLFGGSFDAALKATVVFLGVIFSVESIYFRRVMNSSQANAECPPTMILLKSYAYLSLASALNGVPQVIIRYLLLYFAGAMTLGNFAVQYQISVTAVPLVTAISQIAIVRKAFTIENIKKDMFVIFSISCLLIALSVIAFLSPLSSLVQIVFSSWTALDYSSTIILALTCLSLCMIIYLGFLATALERTYGQAAANSASITVLAISGPAGGFLWGGAGVIAAFFLSTLVRGFILLFIVRRAVPT